MKANYAISFVSRPKIEQGFVVIIVLIVMLIMMIGGIALMRSVDTATLLAGNAAFRRDAASRADQAIATALSRFRTGALGTLVDIATTENNLLTSNYSAALLASNDQGIPNVLLNPNGFESTYTYPAINENGNQVLHLIERMCTEAGPAREDRCIFAQRTLQGKKTGKRGPFTTIPPLFRVTVRVEGPKQTVHFTQAIIEIPYEL